MNDFLLNTPEHEQASKVFGIGQMHNNLGLSYFENGDKAKAHHHFQNALVFSTSLTKIAFIHLVQNISAMYEANYGLKLIQMAINASHNSRDVDSEANLFLRGLCYAKKGMYLRNLSKNGEALEAFDFALALLMYKDSLHADLEEKGQIIADYTRQQIARLLREEIPDTTYPIGDFERPEESKIRMDEVFDQMGAEFEKKARNPGPKSKIDGLVGRVPQKNGKVEEILAEAEQKKSNPAEAIMCYIKALELSGEQNNLTQKARVLSLIGGYFEDISTGENFEPLESLSIHMDYLKRAYKVMSELNDGDPENHEEKLRVCLKIATTYFKLKQANNCQVYLDECRKIMEAHPVNDLRRASILETM